MVNKIYNTYLFCNSLYYTKYSCIIKYSEMCKIKFAIDFNAVVAYTSCAHIKCDIVYLLFQLNIFLFYNY